MWPDFLEAFAHSEHRILGRTLRPFSAYSHFWLRVIGSPLLLGGPVSLIDLETAVRICSCDYGQAPSQLKPRWRDRLVNLCNTLRYDVGGACEAFGDYIMDFNSPPERRVKGDSISTTSAEPIPYQIWLVSGLMTLFHMSERDAWMMPIGQAEWYLAASDIHRDKECSILPGHDREFIEGMKAELTRTKQTNGK